MDWCPVQGEFRTLIEQGTEYRPVPAYMYMTCIHVCWGLTCDGLVSCPRGVSYSH